jgi:hypothetical protein
MTTIKLDGEDPEKVRKMLEEAERDIHVTTSKDGIHESRTTTDYRRIVAVPRRGGNEMTVAKAASTFSVAIVNVDAEDRACHEAHGGNAGELIALIISSREDGEAYFTEMTSDQLRSFAAGLFECANKIDDGLEKLVALQDGDAN